MEDQPDWAAWYRNELGGEPNYSVLLEELAASPEERRAILHSYIEPSDDDRIEGRKVPTKAHRAIAELVESGRVRVIITTNLDRLLENALRERSIEPTVVASVDALAGAEPLMHSKCYVLKLHGDYKDARILNTEAELGGYPAPYDALLDRILDEHGLIVSGWSGESACSVPCLDRQRRQAGAEWPGRGQTRGAKSDLPLRSRLRFQGRQDQATLHHFAGPNNPVGSIWIDLSIESFGIHGTPEPGKIGKTFSHGCIRLTNWDAEDLASMVQKSTKVSFKDDMAVAGDKPSQ